MKKDTKLILIVLAGILAIVLLCVFAVQSTQNKALTLEEQVNTAQSDIRVQEKRRGFWSVPEEVPGSQARP